MLQKLFKSRRKKMEPQSPQEAPVASYPLDEEGRNMLRGIFQSLIGKGQTQGLASQLDLFFAAGKLSREDYDALTKELEGK